MARDATVITVPDRSLMNYPPALGGFMSDNYLGPIHLKLAIDKTMANNATLATVPTGLKLQILSAYWEVAVSWSGGTNSAIGVNSDDTDYATAGDILGGAGGDVAATLVSTGRVYKGGTIGAKFGTNGIVVVGSGKLIRYNKVVDTFTAGSGYVHISGLLID
jgi:hypothetical protein